MTRAKDIANIISDANFGGTLDVAGVLTGASLDISGNIDVDGVTNLDVVDIDGAVNMATTLLVTGNVDFNGDLDVDGTTNLDVVDIDGAVDMASTLAVTGIATFTDDIIIGDGKTIGSASDVDAMTIASNGQVTFTQTLIGTDLDISGSIDIDGTTNLDAVDIDGAVQMGASDDDVRMTLQGNNQYRLGLKNAANALVYLGSGGANNFRVSNQAGGTLLELTSASNILLPTASAGIYLGVTSEATSNLLDDYEEGSFTPAPSSGAIANKVGKYIKVGNLVHVTMVLSNYSGASSSAVMQVGGIPFTNNGVESVGSNYVSNVNTGSSAGHVSTYVYPNNTIFRLYDQGDDVGVNALTYASFDTSSAVTVSFTYEIA